MYVINGKVVQRNDNCNDQNSLKDQVRKYLYFIKKIKISKQNKI